MRRYAKQDEKTRLPTITTKTLYWRSESGTKGQEGPSNIRLTLLDSMFVRRHKRARARAPASMGLHRFSSHHTSGHRLSRSCQCLKLDWGVSHGRMFNLSRSLESLRLAGRSASEVLHLASPSKLSTATVTLLVARLPKSASERLPPRVTATATPPKFAICLLAPICVSILCSCTPSRSQNRVNFNGKYGWLQIRPVLCLNWQMILS